MNNINGENDSNSPTFPNSDLDMSQPKCKRRYNRVRTLQQREIANKRERKRMTLIYNAFEALRTILPNIERNRRMTRLELLHSTIRYIIQLQQLLDQTDYDLLLLNKKVQSEYF